MAEAVQSAHCRRYLDQRSLEDTAETHKSPALKNKYEYQRVCVDIHDFFFYKYLIIDQFPASASFLSGTETQIGRQRISLALN